MIPHCLQVVPAPVKEPPVHVQGQEPLTASMLAAAPLMDQKQLLGVALFNSVWLLFYVDQSNLLRVYLSVLISLPPSPPALTQRGAIVPADSCPSPKLGWKNHWDAAGDRQLRAAAHVGVARVSAL